MKLDEQSNQSFSDLIAPIKIALDRYWRIAWPPATVIVILGLFLSIKLAPYYSADVLISNQQQRMNSKLVVSPSKEDQNERLQSLIFEVISRPRLSNILDQYPVYPNLKGAKLKDDALKKLRASLEITPESSTTGQRLNQTFRLSFSHRDPQLAYQVTKAISDLFIDESMLNTKIETEGTVEFIDTKLREARQQLEATEKAVQDFQKQNFGKLPDDFQSTDARLKSAQSQLATNSQMIIAKTEKLNFLRREMQLVSQEAPVNAGNVDNISDPESGLAQLESALVVLRSKYSDEHPDVISTKKRIEGLRARIAGSRTGKSEGNLPSRGNPETRSVRRAIGDLEAELVALNQENVNLKNTLTQLENNIKDMPIKAPDLIKIKRDYANVKDNYEKLLAARQEAELQKDLISSQKGTQFRIVDPPAIPTIADGPPRLLIAVASLIIGLILFLSVAIGAYFSSDSFKFKEEIESELGLEVLGVVPPIATKTAGLSRQNATNLSILLSIGSMILGLVLIIILT